MHNDPETRTKRMEDSVKSLEEGPAGFLIEFQPGNGTRYQVGLTKLDDYPNYRKAAGGVMKGGWLVTWLNHSCCVLQPDGYLAAHFLQEKLGGSPADAIVLSRLIAHFTDREVEPWEPAEE